MSRQSHENPNPAYLAREADLVVGTGSTHPVGLHSCTDCDAPNPDAVRMVDVVPNPDWGVDPEAGRFLPVYGRIPSCNKDWLGQEDFVEYTFPVNVFGYTRLLSTEMVAQISGGQGCFSHDERQVCELANLTFDPGADAWDNTADPFNTVGGSLFITVWGEFDGLNERWFIDVSGCQTFYAGEATVLCLQPLRLQIAFGLQYDPALCCDAPNGITLEVWALNRPLYLARHVDHLPGTGTSNPRPGYGTAECCEDPCDHVTGCCDHEDVSVSPVDFTTFDFLSTCGGGGGSCSVTAVTVNPGNIWQAEILVVCTTGDPNTQSTPVTVTLVCQAADPRGAQNYVLQVSSSLGSATLSPTEYSCDPFALVFEDILWEVTLPDLTVCSGSFSVSITPS